MPDDVSPASGDNPRDFRLLRNKQTQGSIMSGSSGSGHDMEAGTVNFADSTTFVGGGRPSELDVDFDGYVAFEAGPRTDEQFPNTTLNGIVGRGWNNDTPSEPGAGVIGVGSANRGPGVVGLGAGSQIISPFLGSTANLFAFGIGGTGLIGIGGDGLPLALVGSNPSLPGVGIVGQGGVSASDAGTTGNGAGMIGIAGGRNRPPQVELSQDDLAATSDVGVVGFGGDGTLGGPFPGAGVRGVGGFNVGVAGPGVVGVAGDVSPVPADSSSGSSGVAGFARTGAGIFGRSDENVAVLAESESSYGGFFSSGKVAQIHLQPHKGDVADPNGAISGLAGDLLVLRPSEKESLVQLWFCRAVGFTNWVQLV
jgi:hypothetical protein